MSTPLRVTVWGENQHEKKDANVQQLYPEGMHGAIAAGIRDILGADVTVRTVTLDDPGAGLPDEVLNDTDVLTWWGHIAHDEVPDELVERVHQRVLAGMGLIVLHSGHYSKIFKRVTGATCSLGWRNQRDRELVWQVDPQHPIAQGVPNPIIVPEQEMYSEPFDIPTPDELIFISNFSGGEVFRSGVTYKRGRGKVFYFSPGDQDYPVYHQAEIRQVIANGVRWAAPVGGVTEPADAPNRPLNWFESK
ncbi:ThuA domain-containing protein [Micrococcales bacterium 31B]|nr:ThuA domain-containing protein [Micrococcales bacterium 31B]